MTDLRRKRGWGYWKRLAKEHIYIYAEPMNTDNNVVEAGVRGAGWRETKVVE